MRKILGLAYLVFLMTTTMAQDIHFSQFNRSYLNLSPALTGDYDGDYRLNGNFRNQWSSVSEPFQTFSFSAEAKSLIKSLPSLNLGLLLYRDEAGLGGLQTTQANLSVSYGQKLLEDSSLVMTIGLQSGLTARSINFNSFSFDQQFDGFQYNPQLSTGENFDRSSYNHLNLNLGTALSYRISRRKTFKLGAAFYNLTSPNQSFQGSNIPLDLRSNFYFEADYIISNSLDVLPAILWSEQGPNQETLLGANFRYHLDDNPYLNRNVYAGFWYRNQDALIASLGMDYKEWQVGISYDINTSNLEVASNNRGGLELSVTYIIKTFNPTIGKYLRCPVFL